MAWMPCLNCGSRFEGEAQNVYVTYYLGDERESYRFVVCVECVDELLAAWRTRALYRTLDGDWELPELSDAPVPKRGPSEPRETLRQRRSGSGASRSPKGRSASRTARESSYTPDAG
jgi:hypothetical protein